MAFGPTDIHLAMHAACRHHIPAEALLFFEQRVADPEPREATLLGAFSGAARRVGKDIVTLDPGERSAFEARGLILGEAPSKAALVRSWLLCAACARLPEEAHPNLVKRAFQTGDNDERCVVLRTLPVLPQPARFVQLAVEACRTNVLDVFQALACDNPYPATFFSDESFNQLVVKALFMGSPLTRLVGLAKRINPELQRMVRDYAAERRAAHRPIPADSKLVEPTLEIDA